MRFDDREDAGRQLATVLQKFRAESPVVVGLTRGGVPVAAVAADALRAPLDALVVRKLGAPIQQVMTISRLVAESLRRPLSTASRTLPSTGRVDRGLTARPTVLRPLARFSCRQEIFMTARSN